MTWTDTFVNASFDINEIGKLGNFAGVPVQQWQLDALSTVVDGTQPNKKTKNEAASNRLKDFAKKATILSPTNLKSLSGYARDYSAPQFKWDDLEFKREREGWRGDWPKEPTSSEKISDLKKNLKFIHKELIKEREARMKAQDELEAERRFIRNRTVLTKEQTDAVAELLAASGFVRDVIMDASNRGSSITVRSTEFAEIVSKAETLLTIQVPTKVEAIVGMRKILEDTECA